MHAAESQESPCERRWSRRGAVSPWSRRQWTLVLHRHRSKQLPVSLFQVYLRYMILQLYQEYGTVIFSQGLGSSRARKTGELRDPERARGLYLRDPGPAMEYGGSWKAAWLQSALNHIVVLAKPIAHSFMLSVQVPK